MKLAAETALQPLIWCAVNLYCQGFFSGGFLLFTDAGSARPQDLAMDERQLLLYQRNMMMYEQSQAPRRQ